MIAKEQSAAKQRWLSPKQVAGVIYRTRTPNEDQIESVQTWMRTGVIPSRKGRTNEADLALFLARSKQAQVDHFVVAKRAIPKLDTTPVTPVVGEEFGGMYREFWKDYFLAMLLRQRTRSRSKRFRGAVLAGQIVVLLLLGYVFSLGLQSISGRGRLTPEQALVADWIDTETDQASISNWHPPVESGKDHVIGVEYRYRKGSRRWIETERIFRVSEETVEELELD